MTEQQRPMEKDKSYLIYVRQDNKGRLIGSSKLDYFLGKTPIPFTSGEEVSLLVADTTELGNKVVINNSHWGLIHSGDIFQSLGYGKRIQGYIKTIREDGKIDVVLRKIGQDSIHALATKILDELNKQGGFLPLHDKSPSLDIQNTFNESKRSFKSAIGQLYKSGEVTIEAAGIRLRNKRSKV
jgi:predicted RNA-binding protein (virulence factor B family)